MRKVKDAKPINISLKITLSKEYWLINQKAKPKKIIVKVNKGKHLIKNKFNPFLIF